VSQRRSPSWDLHDITEGLLKVSKKVHPITSLQKKGVRFEWTPDCAMSFQHLKGLLTSASILRIIDLDAEFVV
jgi:hypothetical protein